MGWVFDTAAEKNLKEAIKGLHSKGTPYVNAEKPINAFGEQGHNNIIGQVEKTEALAKKFFASIHQMQSLMDANPEFWDGFVQKAADVISYPNNPEAKKDLYAHLNRLNDEWGDLQEYRFTPKRTAGYHMLGFFTGAGIGVGGGAMVYGIAAGTLTLAMGPWGAAAIAVGIILVGLIIAACEAYLVYKHSRVARDSQLKEITAFINHINGDDGFSKNDAGMIDLHITNNYVDPRLKLLPPDNPDNLSGGEGAFLRV